MRGHDVARIGVSRAEVRNSNLRPGLLVRPVQVQRLRIRGETAADAVPIDLLELRFPARRDVRDPFMDEVDLSIHIPGVKSL